MSVMAAPRRRFPWASPLPEAWAWVEAACGEVQDLIDRGDGRGALRRVDELLAALGDGGSLDGAAALPRLRVLQLRAYGAIPGCWDFGEPGGQEGNEEEFDDLFERVDEVLGECRRWCERVAPVPERVAEDAGLDVGRGDAWETRCEVEAFRCELLRHDGGVNFGAFDDEFDERDRAVVSAALCGRYDDLLAIATSREIAPATLVGLDRAALMTILERR